MRYHVHDGGILRVVSYGRQSDAGGRCSIKLFSSADVPMSSVGRSGARPGPVGGVLFNTSCRVAAFYRRAERTAGASRRNKRCVTKQQTLSLCCRRCCCCCCCGGGGGAERSTESAARGLRSAEMPGPQCGMGIESVLADTTGTVPRFPGLAISDAKT